MRAGSRQHVRVMMLGWEFPPRFAGGLGKACQGLSQGMAKTGAQVFFVLPTFPERLTDQRLEVVGARECLIEAGWDDESVRKIETPSPFVASTGPRGGRDDKPSIEGLRGVSNIEVIETDVRLYPYGAHPEGQVSERILKMVREEGVGPNEGRKAFGARPAGARAAGPARAAGSRSGPPATHRTAAAQGGSGLAVKTTEEEIRRGGEIYGKNLWSEIERYAAMVRHLAESHDVDVVHAHDWMTFPAAFEYQRMTGAPVFVHVHATEYDRSGENMNNDVFRIEREGFRRATHIFAVSRYTAGVIERLYGVNRKKISVVYNAPDESARDFLEAPEDQRRPQVVFLGRLTFQKGPDHFLRAAQLVAKAHKTAKFIFCGTGDMMDQLRHQAHRLGIEDRVHFAGFVDPQGVDQILLRSQALVMPSVSEPFGLVALEAIRCGIPIIISKQSGVREVLHRALQVDFWDHEKLADQMLAALRLPALSKQLVEDGMDQLQQLSWDKSAQRVIDVYHRYLGTTYAQAVGGAHGH